MADVKVPIFRKGKSRPKTTRQRASPPPDVAGRSDSVPSTSTVVRPTQRNAPSLLKAGTKRQRTERNDDTFSDEESARDGPDIKYTSAGSHVRAAQDILDGDEAEALLERSKRQKRRLAGEDSDSEVEQNDNGMYHGAKGYRSHLTVKKDKEKPKAQRIGPQRANPSTIRQVTITDYQPDVCKDYKETGYCGFGDTCKFLHDRGTYLAGWQIDNAWDAQLKADAHAGPASDTDSDEEVPFACYICRKEFTDPVVTRCGHYFCSTCAIKRFTKRATCAACGANTGGIFNRADKIIEKLRKKKDAKGDGSDDDGEGGELEIEGLAEADD